MNIEGVVQQLPLFEPPINPALLVRAKAIGVDLASALSDFTAPTPFYRFSYVSQKALELCAEVRSLGASLLSALEKKDAEALGALRATQETSLLKAARDVKQKQIEEAEAALAGLQKTREVTDLRRAYYTTLTSQFPSPYLNANEQAQLDDLARANELQEAASKLELLSNILNLIPNITASVPPGATFGGSNLGPAVAAMARLISIIAADFSYQATRSSILGGHIRRADEWNFQLSVAAKELEQIDKQIAGAQIRSAIAQLEIANHDKQIENAGVIEDFLRNKYTNEDLYGWMVSQTSTLFFQCYQMAYELAKRAEACFRVERGLSDSSFINFGYWDNLRKGLLCGEQLYLDLKRMELAFMDQNRREYEITRNISLLLLNPLAVIALKETGTCVVSLPEAFFDMDYPGHYMRCLRSMSLTIPCVTGPYTSVNCTLTLLKNSVRTSSDPNGSVGHYSRDASDDPRFVDNFAATQSIATSTAQNDPGMFEVNFRDERYLVFEGAGVISTWQLDLPKDCNAFDFETISDVILNLKYTARDGGARLRDAAIAERVLPAAPQQGASTSKAAFVAQSNRLRLFSLKHEFPADWYRFLNPADTAESQIMQIGLTIERFPFQYRGRRISIDQMELFLKFKDIYDSNTYKADPNNPTPQGDYAKGAPLTVRVSPAGGPVVSQPPLKSDSSFFNGIPHSLLNFSNQNATLSTWSLEVDGADINKIAPSLWNAVTVDGTSYYHLKPELIEDIFAICHYGVA